MLTKLSAYVLHNQINSNMVITTTWDYYICVFLCWEYEILKCWLHKLWVLLHKEKSSKITLNKELSVYICMQESSNIETWSRTVAISLPFSTVSRLILLAKRTSASALISPFHELYIHLLHVMHKSSVSCIYGLDLFKVWKRPASTNIFMFIKSRTRGSWKMSIPSRIITSEGFTWRI